MVYFKLISFLICLCYIWFDTDAFVEYASLVGLTKDFQEVKKQFNGQLTFPNYLIFKKNNFFSRLVSCPICLSVWLSVISIVGLRLDLCSIPIVLIGTWIGYNGLVKLIKWCNE